MVKVTRRTAAAGAALMAFGLSGAAYAQSAVKVSVSYPLSGNAGSADN